MNIKPAKQPDHVVMDLSASDSEQLAKAGENKADAIRPFKLETILVPVDFSDCAKRALQYAAPFARRFNARLILLHVMPIHYATGWELGTMDCQALIEADLKIYAQEQLITLAKETVPSEVPVEIEVRHGSPAIEIVAFAKEMDVDLILLSTHGHTGRIQAFIGSVASDVTRLAPCPVLAVRQPEHEFIPHKTDPLALTRPAIPTNVMGNKSTPTSVSS